MREHAHDAMAPVWEANHVWLIFVLTVTWTAYPAAFGSIASTLCVALFVAGLGIIVRGAAYALRSGHRGRRARSAASTPPPRSPRSSRRSRWARRSAGSPPGRVPFGNAAGDLSRAG